MVTYSTTIAPGTRGEFEVRTGGATFRLRYYRLGATVMRVPDAGSPRSPFDWRPVTFFGTLEPVRVGQPMVLVLSARETWSTTAVISIRYYASAPCAECGGPDQLRLGRCWRCRVDPSHAGHHFQDLAGPPERRWRNRVVRRVDRWLLSAAQRVAEAQQRRGSPS